MMGLSFTRLAVLTAVLCPLVAPLHVPSTAPLTPRVPWKEHGIWDGPAKRPDGGCKNRPRSRDCWNGEFNIDTDMDLKWPNTGKVVKYHLDITNETMAPDGFSKPVLVINGQIPGPTIVADWGDILEITVTSHLTSNGTGLHWHGVRHLGSNEMDGVPGITECPLAPGQTKTYRFLATQYGTSWYHSHYSVQYGDGLWGTMIIKGPTTANYDIDLGTFPLTDWFYESIFTVNAAALHARAQPTAQNILVNGTMTSQHGGKYAVTTLTPGKSHLLRIINVGINNYLTVGLDGHKMKVVAADFTPIVPYETDSITIAVGQRYDVIITATNEVSNYWFRVGTGGTCDGPNSNGANIRSIFRYAGACEENPTNATSPVPLKTGCSDEKSVVPYQKTQVPRNTPKALEVGFTNTAGSGSLVQWLVNNSAIVVELGKPTLQYVFEGNDTFDPKRHVLEVGQKNMWQYWVIQQSPKSPPLPHPIHLHGHDFYVLAQAEGTQWSGDISVLKMDNPIRRDTATLPAGGYLVLAFESDNPGAWLMHCHIPFHIAGGLGVQFVERFDEIKDHIGDLGPMQDNCAKYRKWDAEYPGNQNGSVLIEGDSGLKRRREVGW